MANKTVSTDANHDDFTTGGTPRAAGEDFTITTGATLTIDSMPHTTASGILGDITLTAGTLHIDGSRTYEVAYSGGAGGSLPAVGTAISWNAGTDTGKVIRLNSGDATSGVLTLTKTVGKVTPDDADSITDGTWSADLDSVKIGFLIVYGEDQEWGSVDAQSTLRITGDWYEVGTGDGTDDQTFTLPHTGHQHAVWVETGDGTDTFQIWHRVCTDGASTVFYNAISQFGATWESGFVFGQTFGNATLTFGTSSAGGVPPDGARIRIPNVHLGTTTTAAPTTEINSSTLANHVGIISPNTNLNVEIDHLNCSSMRMEFIGTNQVTLSDTCWSLSSITNLINKVNATVSWDNCALIYPGAQTGGMAHAAQAYIITDNVGGITINDCVFMGGLNNNNTYALSLVTMANIDFTGTNKFVTNQQDENNAAGLRGSVAVNVTAETIVSLGCSTIMTAGCSFWEIDELVGGLPPGRGTTEQNCNWISATGIKTLKINSGRKAAGSKATTAGPILLTDAFDTWIQNFGEIDDKIDGESRMTYVASMAGITTGVTLKRLWFDTMNGSSGFAMLNSAANITIENCSADYNDEIEIDANRTLYKGVHGGSGGPGSATGIEDGYTNVIGSCFYDLFTSDTTGFVGLVFNDKGNFHASDVTTTSGTPFFNGLGRLVMNTVGDQIVYEFPYWIKGHTGLVNTTPSKVGSNPSNISAEYQIDTGSGYGTLVNGAGSWDDATGAKLNAETIGPGGFKIKFRFTTTTGTSQNLNGFAVYTTTTIADQKANLYPLVSVPVQIEVLDAVSFVPVENARVLLEADTGGDLPVEDAVTITRSSSTASVVHTAHGMLEGSKVVIRGAAEGAYNGVFTISNVTTDGYDYTVSGTPATPATGTIKATAVILSDVTDSNGMLLDSSFNYTSDQPVYGIVRRATSGTFYKTGTVTGTITDVGFTGTVLLIMDE